jgi:acetoin utilization deacetylase AcuC-like enzyme
MGFCLLNNVAVAAAAARAGGVERVAVFDWDVHHGNGTQHIFEADPAVLYVSTHQYPYYPGTGASTEVGTGAGAGATVNVPLPEGCGDAELAAAWNEVVLPALERHRPDLILISGGFDAHANDPLAGMQVSTEGFGKLAGAVCAVADRLCHGRVVCVLEGGYDLGGLGSSVTAVFEAFMADERRPSAELEVGGEIRAEAREAIDATRAALAAVGA